MGGEMTVGLWMNEIELSITWLKSRVQSSSTASTLPLHLYLLSQYSTGVGVGGIWTLHLAQSCTLTSSALLLSILLYVANYKAHQVLGMKFKLILSAWTMETTHTDNSCPSLSDGVPVSPSTSNTIWISKIQYHPLLFPLPSPPHPPLLLLLTPPTPSPLPLTFLLFFLPSPLLSPPFLLPSPFLSFQLLPSLPPSLLHSQNRMSSRWVAQYVLHYVYSVNWSSILCGQSVSQRTTAHALQGKCLRFTFHLNSAWTNLFCCNDNEIIV